MVRGPKLFYCSECRKRFVGVDIEYGASIFSAPIKCPQCGSWHTRPWSLLPVKVANLMYKKIWEANDRDGEKSNQN